MSVSRQGSQGHIAVPSRAKPLRPRSRRPKRRPGRQPGEDGRRRRQASRRQQPAADVRLAQTSREQQSRHSPPVVKRMEPAEALIPFSRRIDAHHEQGSQGGGGRPPEAAEHSQADPGRRRHRPGKRREGNGRDQQPSDRQPALPAIAIREPAPEGCRQPAQVEGGHYQPDIQGVTGAADRQGD